MFGSHKLQEWDIRSRATRKSRRSADDRRRAPRATTDLTGYIKTPQNNQIVHCDILDFSDKGARIRPTDVSQVPKFFELRMFTGGSYLCEVIRKRGDHIGVQFLQHA